MNTPYPWHHEIWRRALTQIELGRLGHALLLSGRAGIGKGDFANALSARLLCEVSTPSNGACGQCRSCHLLEAGSHPDIRRLSPPEDSRAIGIDQVRELGEFFALKSHYGRGKVAVVMPAESLQRAAANALLKILEEPPGTAFIILVSHQAQRLLPTIRSRCQQLNLDRFSTDRALAWLRDPAGGNVASDDAQALLALAHGAPLAARAAADQQTLTLANDIAAQMAAVGSGRVHAIQAAQRFGSATLNVLIDLMLEFAHSLALKVAGIALDGNAELFAPPSLLRLADHLHSQQLSGFTVAALEIKALTQANTNFREADLLDRVWLAWMRATRSPRA